MGVRGDFDEWCLKSLQGHGLNFLKCSTVKVLHASVEAVKTVAQNTATVLR